MPTQASDERPNVVLIIGDEHNAKVLGCAGHPDVQTPNIDRLAAEGVMFERAITVCPICTPTRASIYCGQYLLNHGYHGLAGAHKPDMSWLPHIFTHLRRAGYVTAVTGVLHLPGGWVEDELDYRRSDYRKYLEEIGGYYNEVQQRYSDSNLPLNKTGPGSFSHDGGPSPMSYPDTNEGYTARESIALLDEFGDRPFFLQVGFQRPHSPYTPAPRFWEMYDEDSITLPPNADYDMSLKPPHMRQKREYLESLTEEWVYEPKTYEAGRRRNLRAYLGCVSQVDYSVGLVREALEERGLMDNTIIIYSSDHGNFAGEHGITEKAPGIGTDAITRVPMIWRWPSQFAAGARCGRLVQWVDFVPTMVELLGLDPMPTCDGHSMTALLEGGGEPLRDVAVTEFPWSKSIRDERWRYVHYQPEMFGGEDVGELYDLDNDPWEISNLYYDPAHHEKVNEMRHRLLDWMIKTKRVVTTHPGVDENGERLRHKVDEDGRVGYARTRLLAEQGMIAYL